MSLEEQLRCLPSLDGLLREASLTQAAVEHGRSLTVAAAREAVDQARRSILEGSDCPETETLVADILSRLVRLTQPTLRPAINATGVIIHTNLGRAPLSESARRAMVDVSAGYCDLEYDLEHGRRGSRYDHARELLCRVTGAESALVVNNNAGALLLVLAALAGGREAVVSRGQLVEIGGGFRVPDVMAQSNARLVEVGTTNRTRMRDFEAAVRASTALLVAVHRSNFLLRGFTEDVPLEELVALGQRHAIPVVNDLGSGTLLDTSQFGLAAEPTVQESVSVGAAVTTFSGDKLLGGPQAGIIVGHAELLDRIRRYPLTRALRVDKTTLAALQATLLHYLREEAVEHVPVWRMIAASSEGVSRRAEGWVHHLQSKGMPATLIDGRSPIGGGALPGQTLPTSLVSLEVEGVDRLAAHLRSLEPPVIGRIENDRFLLDPRTVLVEQDSALLGNVARAWAEMH